MKIIKKISVLLGIFLIAIFFIAFMNAIFVHAQNREPEAYVFFRTKQVTIAQDNSVTVNIYIQTPPQEKVSSASITVKYPAQLLELKSFLNTKRTNLNSAETACTNEGFRFNEILKMQDNKKQGILRFSLGAIEPDEQLPEDTFCLTSLSFRVINPELSKAEIQLANEFSWKIAVLNKKVSLKPVNNSRKVQIMKNPLETISPTPVISYSEIN